MKHFVRILVTVLILGLLGGGVWYFFFREDPNQVVFNRLTETKVRMDDEIYILDKNQHRVVGYDNILEYLKNYKTITVGGASAEIATTSKLGYLRGNIFGSNGLVGLNEISDDAIDYYYSLSASANKVKKASRDNVTGLIKSYNSKVDQVISAAKDVIYFQDIKKITNNDNMNDQGYKDIVNKTYLLYEAMLDKQYVENQLFFALRDYVNTYVFGTFVPDHKATAYDIYVNQLEVYVDSLKNSETLKSDLIAGTYNSAIRQDTVRVKSNVAGFESNGYINTNSVAYLDSYKRLQQSGVLAKVIKLSNAAKVAIKDADYNPNSDAYISSTVYNSLNLEKLKDGAVTYPSIKNDTNYFTQDEKDVLLECAGSNAVDAVGLTSATFSNAEIKAIINGENPSIASKFTDEVIYKTLQKLFKDNANTLDNKMAEDAVTYGIDKEYLVDAQNVLKYIYNGLTKYAG